MTTQQYTAVVIGVSAGGLTFLKALLGVFPENFPPAVIIVQHVSASSDNSWIALLDQQCKIRVKEAEEKERILPGTAYIAPANYHLLVEYDRSFTLTNDQLVNFARPSIDVLFETAANVYRTELIGILGTGANSDGAEGMVQIQNFGGKTIVQHPDDAQSRTMPQAALNLMKPDQVLTLDGIAELLLQLFLNKLVI